MSKNLYDLNVSKDLKSLKATRILEKTWIMSFGLEYWCSLGSLEIWA